MAASALTAIFATFLVSVSVEVSSKSNNAPVVVAAPTICNAVPVVRVEAAIYATLVVVFSASTSIAYPPAARLVSINTPLPASACTVSAVDPVAEA